MAPSHRARRRTRSGPTPRREGEQVTECFEHGGKVVIVAGVHTFNELLENHPLDVGVGQCNQVVS